MDAGKAGIAVISGLAMGIDIAAHEGNTAGGGRSVAVLGCGIDTVYPPSSAAAARRMLEAGGCLISEYGIGSLPLKHHFPERNRIISGIARAVVVVEAPAKSGALITAEFALEQGKDLYVHGRCIASSKNAGLRRLGADGAETVDSGNDILRAWGFDVASPADRVAGVAQGGILLLEKELKGEIVAYAGEYYEIKNG